MNSGVTGRVVRIYAKYKKKVMNMILKRFGLVVCVNILS